MLNEKLILSKLMALAECLDKPLSETTQEIYLNALSGYEDAAVIEAINTAGKTCRFFPKPAELIKMISGDKTIKALAAWDAVLDTVRKKGRRFNGSLGEVSDAAVRMVGGWERICDQPTAQLQFLQRDFIEAYQAAGHTAFMPMLCGTERKALQ